MFSGIVMFSCCLDRSCLMIFTFISVRVECNFLLLFCFCRQISFYLSFQHLGRYFCIPIVLVEKLMKNCIKTVSLAAFTFQDYLLLMLYILSGVVTLCYPTTILFIMWYHNATLHSVSAGIAAFTGSWPPSFYWDLGLCYRTCGMERKAWFPLNVSVIATNRSC